jgi:putative ubiquitin-RnfH superfamily antitoxin RatB of RatAB toxin-antitoxin module
MTATGPDIDVTVVLALADRATEIPLQLPAGATVAEALERSGLAARHPELDMARAPVGIFGRLAERDAILADGDRVEVYRPLLVQPKARRQSRAAMRPKRQLK